MEGGAIPIIHEMLRRIGAKKPKYFAVIDFTSGYHQAPLAEESQKYTAFKTRNAVYEWKRVPMGLKGAPSYFQREVAHGVLGDLLGQQCELFLDDLIIFASEEDEFVRNLEMCLDRLEKAGITCNPEKCRFGHDKIEYVGHVIDKDGLSFSDEKKQEVLDFPPPQFLKELQRFFGMVNYFEGHLRNLATELGPLRRLLNSSQQIGRLVWEPEHQKTFDRVKSMINDIPKLFFVDPTEVKVYTDASDYGIGGYICQLIKSRDDQGNEIITEQPIAFMSKSLTKTERRWTTVEKECYAIYMTLKKYEYLLRDIPFKIKTDHANLLYLNVPPSSKVLRWKIAIQEYDFQVTHIPGKDNIVADAFSRLMDPIEEPIGHLLSLTSKKSGTRHPTESGSAEDAADKLQNAANMSPLPEAAYRNIIRVHNAWMGHRGVDATCKLLQEQGVTWPKMRKHIQQFVLQCPTCQKSEVRRTSYNTHPFVTSSLRPHDRINIDTFHVGTEDEHGNKFVVVIVDTCTRWVELYPIPNKEADTIAFALIKHFGRYGPAQGNSNLSRDGVL